MSTASTIKPLLPRALPPMVHPAPHAQASHVVPEGRSRWPSGSWGARLAQRLAQRGQLDGQPSAHDVRDVITLRHLDGSLRTHWLLDCDVLMVRP